MLTGSQPPRPERRPRRHGSSASRPGGRRRRPASGPRRGPATMPTMPPRPIIPPDDLYARLEVPADATFEAIEIAWRALLKRHHPDVAGADALELAKRINVAHDWLSDPQHRARYDAERQGPRVRGVGDSRRWASGDRNAPRPATPRPPPARPTAMRPAEALRRFLDRLDRLARDEVDRLSVAETTSIAFVASIRRFLAPDSLAAIDSVEQEVRARLSPADWANPAIRDAILAAAHEIVLGHFLDEHLTEPFRGRARDRLIRGWEGGHRPASLRPPTPRSSSGSSLARRSSTRRQCGARGCRPRPHSRIPGRAASIPTRTPDSMSRRRSPVGTPSPGPPGQSRQLDRAATTRATRLLRRTAHALVLRPHSPRPGVRGAGAAPWQEATADPGTGRRADERAEATVRRR